VAKYFLELRNITKKYGDKIVLDNINLGVRRGEMLSLLGPPGSGKTTLLKIIAGLERQDKGDILMEGKVINDLPPYQRGVAMVFETLALYTHMTVYDNIASPLIAAKLPKEVMDKKIKEIAKFLKIEHLLERKADKLSGGERQRVALARALVKDVALYLFDEPFVNLDAKIRSALRTEFKKLKTTLGKTSIFATPDPIEALALSDYIAVLYNGKIIQYGTPIEIYDKPINLWLARYLTGNMLNELYGRIVRQDDGIAIELISPIKKKILVKDYAPNYVDVLKEKDIADTQQEIVITINPSKSTIESGQECHGLEIEADIIGYENHGSELLVFARINDTVLKIYSSRDILSRDIIGTKSKICLDLTKAVIYDKKTGKVLGDT